MYVTYELDTELSLHQLRQRHPSVSLPKKPDAETLQGLRVYPLEVVNAPIWEDGIAEKITPLVENGVAIQQWRKRPLTEDEAAQKAKELERAQKLIGVEFEGVMCSATKDDQSGLLAADVYVAMGQSVNFEFENGSTLTLTPENQAAFKAVWIPFRASFF